MYFDFREKQCYYLHTIFLVYVTLSIHVNPLTCVELNRRKNFIAVFTQQITHIYVSLKIVLPHRYNYFYIVLLTKDDDVGSTALLNI